MTKKTNRYDYEQMIATCITANRQALVKTLYLMYSQNINLEPEFIETIKTQGPGFCNLSGNLIRTYWNGTRVRRMVKCLILQVPNKNRAFSKAEWNRLPMSTVTGPFHELTYEWVKENVTVIADSKPITMPDYHFDTSCHLWVLDQIDLRNTVVK